MSRKVSLLPFVLLIKEGGREDTKIGTDKSYSLLVFLGVCPAFPFSITNERGVLVNDKNKKKVYESLLFVFFHAYLFIPFSSTYDDRVYITNGRSRKISLLPFVLLIKEVRKRRDENSVSERHPLHVLFDVFPVFPFFYDQ